MHGVPTGWSSQTFSSSPETIGEATTEQVSEKNANKAGLTGMVEVQMGSSLLECIRACICNRTL